MNYNTIRKHQREQGLSEMQSLIDSGLVWKMEGSMGRTAMDLLKCGACMLPKVSFKDYYGNHVPSRLEVKAGTTGSYQNSVNYFTSKLLNKLFHL